MLEFLPKWGGPGSMNRFFLRGLGTIAILGFILAALSCAHDQQLVGIEVQPGTENFGATNIPVPADAGLAVQLRAIGHYIHPPVTKDITDQVVWTTDDVNQQMVTVSPTGVLTAVGGACGTSLVFATVTNNFSAGNRPSKGAQVSGSMTANVICFTGANGNDALLTVDLMPAGDGTVSVAAPNQSTVTCSINCTLAFPIGTGPITLTAAPGAGHSFSGYTNCVSQQGLQCTINTLNVDTSVGATFK
jgi:hypothetical protein